MAGNRVVLCLLVVVGVVLALPSSAAVITVTSLADSGPNTLRAAIETANTGPAGPDTIRFGGALSGKTIHLLSDLPTLTDNGTTIDGDIDDNGKPDIALSGDKANIGPGLGIASAHNVIQGLCINYCYYGIYIHDATAHDNRIEACYIGTNLAGSAPAPNENYGIYLSYTKGNEIGGTTANTRNVVSGNFGYGIYGYHANSTTIQGLYCGLNAAGTSVLGNLNGGIHIQYSPGTIVGAAVDTAKTVISGNFGTGINVYYSRLFRMRNTYVGTNATGTLARGNNGSGLYLYASHTATIGGTAALSGNLIAGNTSYGLYAQYCGSGLKLQGNRIGTNLAGTDAVPNLYAGVYLSNCTDIAIGGNTEAARNVISGNGDDAVYLSHCFGANVKGNYLGVGSNGKSDLRNAGDGVESYHSVTVNVGGGTAAERNVIVCDGAGARLSGSQGAGNTVINNYIGYAANGTTALPCGTGASVGYGTRTSYIGKAGKGNRILATGDGVYLYRCGTGCEAVDNRIGAPVGTPPYGSTGLSVSYCAPLIDGNEVFQQSNQGLYAYGPQMTSIVTGNLFRRGGKGVYITQGAQPNLGDLGNASGADNGGNTFGGNADFDIYNSTPNDIKAEGNTFASTKAEQIDARFIYDQLDSPSSGRVDYAPLSSGAPTSVGGRALASVTAVPTARGAQIVVSLASAGELEAQVLNVSGRPVRTLRPVQGNVGVNMLLWDSRSDTGAAVPNGAYLIAVTCRTLDGQQQRLMTRVHLSR